MELNQGDIEQIVESVWQDTLNIHVEIGTAYIKNEYAYEGCVQILGIKNFIVRIRTDDLMAKSAASMMFNKPISEVEDSDIIDSLSEIANMTGGNIKSLFGQDYTLKFPTANPDKGGNFIEGYRLALKMNWNSSFGILEVQILTS